MRRRSNHDKNNTLVARQNRILPRQNNVIPRKKGALLKGNLSNTFFLTIQHQKQ
jgi:hypothetical protein